MKNEISFKDVQIAWNNYYTLPAVTHYTRIGFLHARQKAWKEYCYYRDKYLKQVGIITEVHTTVLARGRELTLSNTH